MSDSDQLVEAARKARPHRHALAADAGDERRGLGDAHDECLAVLERVELARAVSEVAGPRVHFQTSASLAGDDASCTNSDARRGGAVLQVGRGAMMPTHEPAWQTSGAVQPLPSSHAVPSATAVATQLPPPQTSLVVHSLSSLQARPSVPAAGRPSLKRVTVT